MLYAIARLLYAIACSAERVLLRESASPPLPSLRKSQGQLVQVQGPKPVEGEGKRKEQRREIQKNLYQKQRTSTKVVKKQLQTIFCSVLHRAHRVRLFGEEFVKKYSYLQYSAFVGLSSANVVHKQCTED